MAEGRMLKKVICESPRLAALKNDTHRLIYTWLIPHLDVEGRHSADPRVVKSHVAPLLDHISHKIIRSSLNDMAVHNLIILYSIDGQDFLELCRFKKHQVLREGREKPSDIPPSTPSALRRPSVDTARQEKLIEDKLIEAKGHDLNQPVDNSAPPPQKEAPLEKPKSQNTHGERWTEKQGADLDELMQDIKSRKGPRYHQSLYITVQANYNRCNPDAMLHCLQNLIRDLLADKPIPYPGPWLDAALNGNGKQAGENGKFEAAEAEKESEEMKGAPLSDAVKGLTAGIGSRASP
jgi:hypothetical protein